MSQLGILLAAAFTVMIVTFFIGGHRSLVTARFWIFVVPAVFAGLLFGRHDLLTEFYVDPQECALFWLVCVAGFVAGCMVNLAAEFGQSRRSVRTGRERLATLSQPKHPIGVITRPGYGNPDWFVDTRV